jgi:hypothetical protein
MNLRRKLKMHGTALERLRDNGGFTLDTRRVEWVTKGFAVYVNPERTRTVKGEIDVLTLATYAADNRDLLSSAPKVFGAWLDTETGVTYLDVVTVFDSKELALDLAVQHGELAIFDLANGQEIRTGLIK